MSIKKLQAILLCSTIILTGLFFAYTHIVLATTGPVAHWKFDEGIGTTVEDIAGSNDGTLVGGVDFSNSTTPPIDGGNPYSLLFDGTDGTGVVIPDDDSLDMTTGITALAWIYWDGTVGDNVIFDKSNAVDGDTPNYRLILKGDTGRLALWNGVAAVESTGTVTANVWTLVNFTIGTTSTEFFINGVSAGTGNIGLGATTNYNLYIGRDAIGRYFHGHIDEAIIYNRVLSAEEITDISEGSEPPGNSLTDGSDVQGEPEVSVAITDLQVTGSSSSTVSVYLFVPTGSLSMTTVAGLTFLDDAETGSSLYFSGLVADVNTALATLQYTGSEIGNFELEAALVSAGFVYYPGNGHVYEVVNNGDPITADDAKIAANARNFDGIPGYLATITSAEESEYLTTRFTEDGWLGASDAEEEGDWKWIDGPEEGTSFWSGAAEGAPVDGAYSNWAEDEPNDSEGSEDCSQFYAGVGSKWNDLPCDDGNIFFYVTEYGTEENLPAVSTDSLTISIFNGFGTLEEPYEFDNCFTAVNPGYYILVDNITAPEDENCIQIATSSVFIDGDDRTISGSSETMSGVITVEGGPYENIHIHDVTVVDFLSGFSLFDVTSSTIERVESVSAAAYGMYVERSTSTVITSSTVTSAGIDGIKIYEGNNGVTISSSTISASEIGMVSRLNGVMILVLVEILFLILWVRGVMALILRA